MSLSANGENATTLSSQNAVLQLYPKAADITSSNSIKMPIKRKASLRLDKLLEFKRKKQAMTPSQWNKYKKAGANHISISTILFNPLRFALFYYDFINNN